MSKRINFDIDLGSPLYEEMDNREPPVMDCVAIRSQTLIKIRDTANTLGVEGERIVQLLGAKDPADPKAQRGHRIETDREKTELVELLTELCERIDESLQHDKTAAELSKLVTSELEERVGEEAAESINMYSKVRTIRNQIEFAKEKDIDLLVA